MHGRDLRWVLQVAGKIVINAPWLSIGVVTALVLPIVASSAAGQAVPSWRLALSGTGALLAVLCSLGIVLEVRRPWLTKAPVAILALLAYAGVMSFVRRQAWELPVDAEPDDKLAAAIAERLAPAIYDRGPVNLVTAAGVEVGKQRYPQPRLNVVSDVIWTKRDGLLTRQYRGKVHYRGRLPDVSSHEPLDFELMGYSLAPTSGVFTYLIGFVEIDLMMTAQDHVLREHLLDAVRKAQR